MEKVIVNGMVSIIIPVFNCESYLSKCLESVINQTYEDIEIICIDDNSTDKSMKIMQNYAKNDTRIRIIHKINEGVSLARNAGLNIARGQFILFVDGDDWIEESTCEQAVRKAREENADIIMWSYIRERKGESQKKKIFDKDIIFTENTVQKKLHRRMIGILGSELSQPENADALCTVWGKLYQHSIIFDNNIRFYDIREIGTYEDGLFNLLYFQHTQKAVFLNQYLYHYRRTNANSIIETYNPQLVQQWNKLFCIMKNYIQQNNLGTEYKKALQNRISLSLISLGINEMSQKSSMMKKIKNIKKIINNDEYVISVNTLEFQYMPIHWKIFFKAAQKQKNVVIFILLCVIQKIRGK